MSLGTGLESPLARGVAVAAALLGCGAMLWAAGQPIFTDDVWWHLALGKAFATEGPWLTEDPLLFAAAGPPTSSAWLFDVALYEIQAAFGLQGVRVVHVLLVAAILALAWRLLRGAGGAAVVANLALVLFVVLAAYRLVQMRPHLAGMLAALVLALLLLRDESPPSWARVAGAVGLAAAWANLHASFPLALMLVAAALAGVLLLSPGTGGRARRLAAALGLMTVATLLNPSGVGAHLAYFEAGVDTPALASVLDEWAGFGLFRWPAATLPPFPFEWLLVWLLFLGTGWATWSALRARHEAADPRVDPALVAVSWLCLALLLTAVRFTWLAIFPLLLLARQLHVRVSRADVASRRQARVAAVVALVVLLAFLRFGAWPAITRGLPWSFAGYAQPYPPQKHFAHAIWFLRDAGLTGNLYGEYFLSGFAGHWLSPNVRTLTNGSLNVPKEIIVAAASVESRRGERPGESFTALLDRLGVDLFLGIRVPEVGAAERPWVSTTAHLEDAAGWIPIFRNLNSAVYLRSGEAAAENLARLARYYDGLGVPFDVESGFRVDDALADAPAWSATHGVVPRGFARLVHTARNQAGAAGDAARDRLAALYAALSLYPRAVALDQERLAAAPDDVRARRRLVWCLLRLRSFAAVEPAAAALAEQPREDGLSHHLAEAGLGIAGREPEEIAAALATLPFLARAEVPWLMTGVAFPTARRASP